jgi:adenylate cyclase
MDASSEAVAAAEAAIARGDLLAAFDLTETGLATAADARLQYLQVLALARMGATRAAVEHFSTFGLKGGSDVDTGSLEARLLKDLALASTGPDVPVRLRHAAAAYEGEYGRTGDYFPGTNAATLSLLAGDRDRAAAIAASVIESLAHAANYWELASRGEALLVLGRVAESRQAFERAAAAADYNAGAMSSTRRQVRLLCAHLGLAAGERDALLAPLHPPGIVAYLADKSADADAANGALRQRIDAALEAGQIGIGYGGLRSGAEIVMAEALLDRGAELQVILPFDEADFITLSVAPAGAAWLDRYQRCHSRAAMVTFATQMSYVGDPAMYAYGDMLTVGLARLRGRHLDAEVVQYDVADGRLTVENSGSPANIARWQQTTAATRDIQPGREATSAGAAAGTSGPERAMRSILFADFPGFSKLPEPIVPIFWDEVMRRAAKVFDRYQSVIDYQNTWGDALYVIMSTVTAGAEIGLALQASLAGINLKAMGLARPTSLRIGLHYGPLYRGFDYVNKEMTFYGTQVSRAARVEPVTPPGCVYATEPFAAILSTEADRRFSTTYVGQIALAKHYGAFRMYQVEYSGAEH